MTATSQRLAFLSAVFLAVLMLAGCESGAVADQTSSTEPSAATPLSLDDLVSGAPQQLASAPYAARPRYSGNLISAAGNWLAWVHLPAREEPRGPEVEVLEQDDTGFASLRVVADPEPSLGMTSFSDPLEPLETGVVALPQGLLWNVPLQPDDSSITDLYFYDPPSGEGRALTAGRAIRTPAAGDGRRIYWAEANELGTRLVAHDGREGEAVTLLTGEHLWSWVDASPNWLLWSETQDEGPRQKFHLLALPEGREVESWQRNHDQDGEVEVPLDISGDFYLYLRRREGQGARLGHYLRHLPSGREQQLPTPPSFAQDFHVPEGTIRVPLEMRLVGGLLYWAEEYRRIPGDGTYEGWSIGVADISELLQTLEEGAPVASEFAPPVFEAAYGEGSTELLDVHLSESGLFWAEGTAFHAWYESTGKTGEGGIPTEQTLHALLPAN